MQCSTSAGSRPATAIRGSASSSRSGIRAAWLGEQPLQLSAREFALLQALLERPEAVLSRAQLEERLYGWNEPVGSNTVEVHIHNLRRKLGERAIRNVRGVGYTIGDLESPT